MKSKRTTKHRGEILQTAVENSGINVIVVAKRAGYSRSSYYNHIMDPELSFEILQKYGNALNYDFKADLPEMSKHILEEEGEEYVKPANMEQALKAIDKWKAKYYAILEKYNQLLEEKLKK